MIDLNKYIDSNILNKYVGKIEKCEINGRFKIDRYTVEL